MKLSGNTIFITGGGSGIGRGLAEAFHNLGNEVIIGGRRVDHLKATVEANPGMHYVTLDVNDVDNIHSVTEKLVTNFPRLNVLINNAGIMEYDDAAEKIDDGIAIAIITTNLLGPIRVTSALIDHLKQQETAAVIHVSSALAFVPMAANAVYSSTKAALHSYTLSQRYKLRGTSVEVLEIVPPRVATDLLNGHSDPSAMPLSKYIDETMEALRETTEEVLIQMVYKLRNNPGLGEDAFVIEFNDMHADH